ncbi:gluconolaconase [Streptoverticillium reticulum]|uniref:gluconolaconase n=1 Tax=Streptoverticillium reticulum TaxID=1433415 RepID=UPI0039BF50C1
MTGYTKGPSGEDIINPVGTCFLPDIFVRHPLTTLNQSELNISGKAADILARNQDRLKLTPEGGGNPVAPDGFSLGDSIYLAYPSGEPTANQRGWHPYFNLGVPLIEEQCPIMKPPPEVVSKNTYINGTDQTVRNFRDSVTFQMQASISWSLQGTIQLTFGARASASVQAQLQKSMQLQQYQKVTLKNSKDNQGVDNETQTQATSTATATGSATGTGEVSAQLMVGITGSISGSLTTSWSRTSEISGTIPSRVDVIATVRRRICTYNYKIPVTFGGWVAVHYPVPVQVPPPPAPTWTPPPTQPGPQPTPPNYAQVIAWPLAEIANNTNSFDMADGNRKAMLLGTAETNIVTEGEHRLCQPETINTDGQKEPYYDL